MQMRWIKKTESWEEKRFKQFFRDHPSISIHGLSEESGVKPRTLRSILSGERSLTKKTVSKIMPVMIKYGYIPETIIHCHGHIPDELLKVISDPETVEEIIKKQTKYNQQFNK